MIMSLTVERCRKRCMNTMHEGLMRSSILLRRGLERMLRRRIKRKGGERKRKRKKNKKRGRGEKEKRKKKLKKKVSPKERIDCFLMSKNSFSFTTLKLFLFCFCFWFCFCFCLFSSTLHLRPSMLTMSSICLKSTMLFVTVSSVIRNKSSSHIKTNSSSSSPITTVCLGLFLNSSISNSHKSPSSSSSDFSAALSSSTENNFFNSPSPRMLATSS
mmetsp:Transcript_38065/g.60204  ORF Transcript_38065/g.60204 Transcript_38065/m.60204 type:complete len:215 (-) Transcript_38065:1210-1854(-)